MIVIGSFGLSKLSEIMSHLKEIETRISVNPNEIINSNLLRLKSLINSAEIISEVTFNEILVELYKLKDQESYQECMNTFRSEYAELSTDSTMQGRALMKKYGYAGDFEIIDKIYTEHISDEPKFRKWDIFFQNQPAPIAVRNRKKYFIEKLENIHTFLPQRVLNLASGPCRDVLELFEKNADANYQFDCVDLDKNAIEYAKELTHKYSKKITFINQNIFRFTPEEKYDIIWSAGLFDYFDDKTFEKILKRLIESNPHAKIIIGNFSDQNPTMQYMELIGE